MWISLSNFIQVDIVFTFYVNLTGFKIKAGMSAWDEYLVILEHIEAETNCSHFADNIFTCIFLNENVWVLLKISLKFVPKVQINNISALVQIMAWRWPSTKPESEPMMVNTMTHICVTRPQWIKHQIYIINISSFCLGDILLPWLIEEVNLVYLSYIIQWVCLTSQPSSCVKNMEFI